MNLFIADKKLQQFNIQLLTCSNHPVHFINFIFHIYGKLFTHSVTIIALKIKESLFHRKWNFNLLLHRHRLDENETVWVYFELRWVLWEKSKKKSVNENLKKKQKVASHSRRGGSWGGLRIGSNPVKITQ